MSFAGTDTAPRRLAVVGGRIGSLALHLSVLVALLVTWQILAVLTDDPVFWPAFTDVAARLWDAWLTNPEAWIESV
ncbi:MAG: hypothetical protein ACRDGD_05715, partial [Candidatus Limnocylindria bacterium]